MQSTVPDTAKSMILVAGKPFIAWQLEWLGAQGVSDVVLSIGYRGEQIRSYVNDGQRSVFACATSTKEIVSSAPREHYALAVDAGALDDRFFVLYGDSYLDVSLAKVWSHFGQQGCNALMTVYRNDNEGEVSNVVFDGTLVTRYAKN
jgi:N-acetyl-alpha-D-muramate 1-phosphate uridylyltransferase